ncbi:hypothetical protein NPIL_601441 [Nephila pilipes]|uniref:Uncharacterized protein n=1 Tax=Nephila pilipes TaxID=299642 RepID=A0A8X6UPJ3_NEPPI|nr:hypothetical protein NPIL_601441 [Nephila pilipes]
MKKSELRRLIDYSDVFKNDIKAVKSAVEDVLENRNKKSDQDGEIEIERLKIERIKLELQLAQVKAKGNNTSFDQGCKSEPEESLDSLIKSVRTLTTKPPVSVEATLANLRTQFWVTIGRSTVKRVLNKCLKCLKLRCIVRIMSEKRNLERFKKQRTTHKGQVTKLISKITNRLSEPDVEIDELEGLLVQLQTKA